MAEKSAIERADDFLLQLGAKKDQWDSSIALPFTRAYTTAYRMYEKKMNDDKEQAKAVAEMFVVTASIVSGTVLMAAFATASLRILAGEALLSYVCKNNLERIFNLMAWTFSKGPLMFAIGGFWDKAGDKIGEMVKKGIAASLAENPKMIQGNDPLIFHTYVQGFLDDARVAATKAAMEIRSNNHLSGAEKQSLVEELEKSSFNNPPQKGVVNETLLAEKMELSIYFAQLLSSVTVATGVFTNPGAAVTQWTQKPIDILPTDPKYPKNSFRYPESGEVVVNTDVKFASQGSLTRERVDELHGKFLGGKFYTDQGVAGQLNYVTTRDDLMRAQRALERLADSSRPTSGLSFRM
jgi:hypothetical protein